MEPACTGVTGPVLPADPAPLRRRCERIDAPLPRPPQSQATARPMISQTGNKRPFRLLRDHRRCDVDLALDRIAVAALACWLWQVGERHAPRNALPGCGLPPDARRHATIEQLCGFGQVSGTGRSRPPPHGPDLARPGSHRLRRRSPARLSAHGIDGVRGLRVDQAGPILRPGGRRASGPLRLQPFEPRAARPSSSVWRWPTWPSEASTCSTTSGTAIRPAGSSSTA